jgi:hypothetical protein
VIRYLDRHIKSRSLRPAETDLSGSLRIQAPEEMFPEWEDCERFRTKVNDEYPTIEVPRHLRAIINCVLFQRSKGRELSIITEDLNLISLAEGWDVRAMTVTAMDTTSFGLLEKFHREIKAYESHRRRATGFQHAKQRSLWAPSK